MLHRPKLRKRMCLVDQLPCGSVLTPAISCTKFKVHSAHADSPMAKTLFLFLILRGDQSLLHRPKLRKKMCLWTNSLVGQFLHQVSLVQSSRSIQHMQTVPWPKHFFFFLILRGEPVFASQTKTQEENVLGGPTPLWVSSYTSYLLYSSGSIQLMETVPWPKHFFFFNFKGGPVFVLKTKTQEENVLGGPTPFWVSSYTSYLLYKVQGHMQTVPWPKHFFFFLILRGEPVFASQTKTQEENVLGGPTPLWVSSYTSYLLYKVQGFKGGPVQKMCLVDQLPCWSVLTPGISCTKFKVHSAHADSPMAKTLFLFLILRGEPVFASQTKTQEENLLGGPTPLWVSSYTTYLLYKVQGPFSTGRQSHGQNTS